MPSVVAFVTDLIFGTKIASTARSLGIELQTSRSLDDFRARLANASVAIVDLNASGSDPIGAVRAACEATSRPHVVAYLSHVQTELAEAARQAGAHEVIPRSVFSSRLPQILGGASGGAAPGPE